VRSNADDVLASRRLGIYLDDVYWVFEEPGGSRISTDRSFLLFLCEVGERFDRLTLFGRTVHGDAPSDYVLPRDVELVELPHYANLRRIFAVLKAAGGSLSRYWRGLDRVDTLWIFGPHPFAVAFVILGTVRRKRVFLGVRQDSVKVYQARLPGLRWAPAILVVRMLDGIYRLLARRLPTTVQGAELAASYRGSRTNVLTATESVVRAADLAPGPPERNWSGEVELLTVGRLEPEKNPLLLVEALARLERERPGRYRLTWVGRGPLDEVVRQRASELGVLDRIEFHGYVAFDGGLLDLYRRAHMFVHVSLSEGMPKVLIEALACATPIVATDVGGVRAALADGSVGLLVPADDLDALVEAILRISEDPQLREGLVARGLELVTDLTLEAEVERVAGFLARHLTTPPAADARGA
jgi:glycosyltransferase involved in cell wall biosynthesis